MPKIQILNETQVSHFVDTILPKLQKKFNAKQKELEELAKKEIGNFADSAEVIELTKEQLEQVEKTNKLIFASKQLQELDEDYIIKSRNYFGNIITTEEGLKKLLEDQKGEMNELLEKLSRTKLNVNQTYHRNDMMINELRARLSMTAVGTFDYIQDIILKSIDINSYFTINTLTE